MGGACKTEYPFPKVPGLGHSTGASPSLQELQQPQHLHFLFVQQERSCDAIRLMAWFGLYGRLCKPEPAGYALEEDLGSAWTFGGPSSAAVALVRALVPSIVWDHEEWQRNAESLVGPKSVVPGESQGCPCTALPRKDHHIPAALVPVYRLLVSRRAQRPAFLSQVQVPCHVADNVCDWNSI